MELNYLFWILFTVGIIFVIWYFSGNSPTLEQTLLVLTLSLIVKISGTMKGIQSDLNNLKKKFNFLAGDFKFHIKHK